MNVVILGAGGLWGRACVAAARASGHPVIALRREDLDVTNADRVEACLKELGPDWVMNAAAWARMDRCREDPAKAWVINVEVPIRLGRLAERLGFRLCHVSSDYVFAGLQAEPYRESDREEPLSAYGHQKLAADEGLLEMKRPEILIVRVAWLFGPGGTTFMSQMPRLLREQEELQVAEGRVGSCLFAGEGASVAFELMERNVSGLVHLVHRGAVTWLDFAKACREEMQARGETLRCQRILGVPLEAIPGLADPRPPFSILAVDRLEHHLGRPMSDWRDGLKQFLDQEGSAKVANRG